MSARWLLFLAVPLTMTTACGGGGGGGADAGPTGPCTAPLSMVWPDLQTPSFCALPWAATDPALKLTECGEVYESCSSTGPTPDLACLDGQGEPPATPATVTMTGFIDVFSSGPNADKARIEIYRASDLANASDFSAATPIAQASIALDANSLVDARGCPKDTDFMQGQCVVPTEDCAGACDKNLQAGQFCYQTACEDLQRWEVRYSIDNVPTNQFLVVRTVGIDANGMPQILGNTWAQLVQDNVYLGTGDRACTDAGDTDCIDVTQSRYQTEINLLSSQDYMTIPTSAGLSAGITPGNGAIAGEVHDCNGVRMQHAQVGFSTDREPRVLVYFNGNPVKTLPRLQRSALGTNTLGLYAGLDITPGPIEVIALGVDGTAVRDAGRFATRIWPDSVTLVRIGGGRPQLP